MEADVNAVSRYVATPSVKRLDLRRDTRRIAALAALPPLALGAVLLFLAVRRKTGRQGG